MARQFFEKVAMPLFGKSRRLIATFSTNVYKKVHLNQLELTAEDRLSPP
jgi:hypothetical protein